MRVLVTGSSGHLGEALVRTLQARACEIVAVDIKPGPFTSHVGSISDRAFVFDCLKDIGIVLHAATLHKPHVATHARQAFIDTNISGTLNLLDGARRRNVSSFVFTSTTSVYGDALSPPAGAPAAWITEDIAPAPKNIYGVTKLAAEALCLLAHREGMACVILRTSRFFPEEDDNGAVRSAFSSENVKANEFLYRRVDLEDVVSAHLLATERAPALGFARYIISATTPFTQHDLAGLRADAPAFVRRYVDFEETYARLGWSMFQSIDRVYVNARARAELGWAPRHDFTSVLDRLRNGGSSLSDLAQIVGVKGYHDQSFAEGPYPVG